MGSNIVDQIISFGEILWDLLPGGRTLGGAPLNIAYHLHKLGEDPALISCIGKDEPGVAIRNRMGQLGIRDVYLQSDPNHPTGQVNVQLDTEGNMHYDIMPDAAWDYISFNAPVEQLIREPHWLIYGSLAARSEVSSVTLHRLLEQPSFKVFDLNLRPPFYSIETLIPLLEKADLVKMNSQELGILSGWYQVKGGEFRVMETLAVKFRWEGLVVTKGERGAMLWEKGAFYSHHGYRVDPVDTVGCGDAFLAGYLSQYRKGTGPLQRLSFACALGALVATYSGACPDYPPLQVQQWHKD